MRLYFNQDHTETGRPADMANLSAGAGKSCADGPSGQSAQSQIQLEYAAALLAGVDPVFEELHRLARAALWLDDHLGWLGFPLPRVRPKMFRIGPAVWPYNPPNGRLEFVGIFFPEPKVIHRFAGWVCIDSKYKREVFEDEVAEVVKKLHQGGAKPLELFAQVRRARHWAEARVNGLKQHLRKFDECEEEVVVGELRRALLELADVGDQLTRIGDRRRPRVFQFGPYSWPRIVHSPPYPPQPMWQEVQGDLFSLDIFLNADVIARTISQACRRVPRRIRHATREVRRAIAWATARVRTLQAPRPYQRRNPSAPYDNSKLK